MWLSDLSVRQPVLITMLAAAVLVVGGLLYSRMAVDLMPDVSLPIVAVQTVYPGADPQEVERSVTKPIEDAVASIGGVENVRSTSADSVSLVTVEFKMETDTEKAAEEVRNRVNLVRNTLPSDVKEPVISKLDPSASPVIAVAVADNSRHSSPEALRTLVDDLIKPRLERVSGVASVGVTGGLVREVHVDLKLDRLKAHSVSPLQVVQAIRGDNLDLPVGRLEGGGAEQLLRASGQVHSLDQLGEIPVSTVGGTAVKVKDLATIAEGHAEVRAFSRLDGQDSVVIEVQKQSGSNTIQVTDGVKQELEGLRRQYPDLSFGIGRDQSVFTRDAVQDVQLSLLLGGILATLVVLAFFGDLRNTLVTVAGLPVVVFGTFGVLNILGVSLNVISLMALSLTVGMLIDDAIVVRENIFRHMERGEEPRAAATQGTAEIALAVLAVTLTIVAVFLPVAFTGGLVGKFLRDFGITVVVAVLISLAEAFTFAPMLSAYLFRRLAPAEDGHRKLSPVSRIMDGLYRIYGDVLSWSLRHRAVVVVVALLVLAGSTALLPLMNQSFIPAIDMGEFVVAVKGDPGTQIGDTDRRARVAETLLLKDPYVEHVFTTVGADGTVEKASLTVTLKSRGHTDEVIRRLRPQLEQRLPGVKVTADKQSVVSILGGGLATATLRSRPVQFSVQGPDLGQVDRVSAELVARLAQIPGVIDVDRSMEAGKPSQVIALDRGRATDAGVSLAQMGSTLRVLVNGEQAGSHRDGGKDVDVVVRLSEADRKAPEQVLQMPIVTTRGIQLPLSAVARMSSSTELAQIERENRQRQILVGGGYLGRDLGPAVAAARGIVDSMQLPAGVTIKVSGYNKYMDDAFGTLNLALALSVIFVYMILASQFGSFIHPFTIMLALPFSVVGALLALLAARFSLDMLAMIGMILLVGLVTKNSILLVEFINQLKRRGLGTREEILQAGPIRLRPILMTTLAVIFGMIPVAAGFGAAAELRQPMGISVVGGVITSTLLTLVVVPTAYSLIDDAGQWIVRRFRGPRRGEQQEQREGAASAIK